MELSLVQVVQAISQADEQHDPASIFALVPERIVWSYATAILDDPEQNYLLGPTLLQGIGAAFPQLTDRTAASTMLLHALYQTHDSLIYEAAQRVALSYAREWEKSVARKFHDAFVDRYRKMMEKGDQFIALLALEGAVMLPLYRMDDSLLYSAIGLLLNDFPPLPVDPADPAYLPVKALKLLGRCYDRRPNDHVIAQTVLERIGCANYPVDTEARFTYGMIRLYDAFQASDATMFLAALTDAENLFKTAAQAEEGRLDAQLFAVITQCYILLLTTGQLDKVAEATRQAKEMLTERFLAFGGEETSPSVEMEFRLAQLISLLSQWIDTLAGATRWPDITPPLQVLADIYAAIRAFDATSGLLGSASRATEEFVLLPTMRGRFVQVQEIAAKLAYILTDHEWRTHTSPSEIAFFELVANIVQTIPSPKEWAVTELEKVRVAAEHDAPILARQIAEMLASGKDIEESLILFAWQLLHTERAAINEGPFVEGPAKDIYDTVVHTLHEKLDWDVHSPQWKYLQYAVRLTTQYLVRLYRTTPGEATPHDVKFLFAETIGGLGTRAVEDNLEGHFYNTMYIANWWGVIDRQSQSAAPGRPDLLFRFSNGIVFPVETKRELSDCSRVAIHEHYLTQAQSYAGGTHGVSFLFVLDLTSKAIGTPLPNVRDCCYIDHRPTPNAVQPDYVIVVIFPANRLRPSDHSWSGKKKRSDH
jgi:hypothetical protein